MKRGGRGGGGEGEDPRLRWEDFGKRVLAGFRGNGRDVDGVGDGGGEVNWIQDRIWKQMKNQYRGEAGLEGERRVQERMD